MLQMASEPNATCTVCGTPHYVQAWRLVQGLGRFCSYACRNAGRSVKDATRAKMRVSQQARGSRSAETRAKMSAAQQVRAQQATGHSRMTGDKHTPLYNVWLGMRHRCSDSTHPSFRYYGARGIAVYPPWDQNFLTFEADIVAAIGERPFGHTLDRIDNDAGYMPGNVRWATAQEQVKNRRRQRP